MSNESRSPQESPITPAEIQARPVSRRGFLRVVGTVAPLAAAIGCENSDGCDSDVSRSDRDPTDPVRAGDRCDRD
jgi:hypothetical protein